MGLRLHRFGSVAARVVVLAAATSVAFAAAISCGSKVFYLPGGGPGDADWTQAGGGAEGRAFVSQELSPPLRLLWQQSLDGRPVGGLKFSGHLALQLTTGPSLFAFDRRSGRLLGRRGIDVEVCAPLTLFSDMLVYGELGKEPALWAFDQRSHDRRWSVEGVACVPVIARRDTLVASGEAGNVVALRAEDGERLWERDVGGRGRTAPSLGDDLLFVGRGDGDLLALDFADGQERWRLRLDSGIRSRPVFGSGTVYVGTAAGTLYAVAADSGVVRWQRTLGNLLSAGLSLTPQMLVAGSVDHHVYGIDPDSGDAVWTFATEGVLRGSPAATAETVYCGSGDGRVYGLETLTGQLQWQFEVDGPVYGPVSVGDRMIGVTTENESVYVFGRL